MSTNTPTTIQHETAGFKILALLDNPNGSKSDALRPYSVQRSDGEIFTIGDRVTNGTQMTGNITEFGLLNGQIFVTTTWSGVGMNLDSLSKVIKLPSRYQAGDLCKVSYFGQAVFPHCWIHKVHFSNAKVFYDLNVMMSIGGKSQSFRLYNVESDFIFDRD